MVRDRGFSVAMVFGMAFLLLVTLVISTVLSALTGFAAWKESGLSDRSWTSWFQLSS